MTDGKIMLLEPMVSVIRANLKNSLTEKNRNKISGNNHSKDLIEQRSSTSRIFRFDNS